MPGSGLISGVKAMFLPRWLGGGDPANNGEVLIADTTKPGGVMLQVGGLIDMTARMQSGVSGTIAAIVFNGAASNGTITFPVAFPSAPKVVVTATTGRWTCSVIAITTTTFDYSINNWSTGTGTSANLLWIAIVP